MQAADGAGLRHGLIVLDELGADAEIGKRIGAVRLDKHSAGGL